MGMGHTLTPQALQTIMRRRSDSSGDLKQRVETSRANVNIEVYRSI